MLLMQLPTRTILFVGRELGTRLVFTGCIFEQVLCTRLVQLAL